MGMNNNSSGAVSKGFKMFEDVLDFAAGGSEDPNVDYSGDYEENARMIELDAQQQADSAARATKEQAQKIRAEQEQGRAKKNTQWGQSNLAMSGSKELVRDSQQQQDRNMEEDELFEGEMQERAILDNGMRGANRYRISKGLSPSTLSLGSTIYKYRR